MIFRTIQRPRPGITFLEGAFFRERVPPGRRWILESILHAASAPSTPDRVERFTVDHNDEQIANISAGPGAVGVVLRYPPKWIGGSGITRIRWYPLRQVLEPGDSLTLTVREISFPPDSADIFWFRVWDFAEGEAIPDGIMGPGNPLSRYDGRPQPPQMGLADPEEGEKIHEQGPPVQPDPPILESPLTPFPVDSEDFPGLVQPREFQTDLGEQLNIGQLPASARDIAVRFGRSLAHLVGADRYASRLIRATAGGALAVTRTHRSYISDTVTSPPFAGYDDVYRRPLNDATFQSLAGEWDVYTLNPEQYSAGVVITDVAPIRVQPGELVELRQEIKALHADEPLSGGFAGNGFRINGWI